jgi:hypothetical protein
MPEQKPERTFDVIAMTDPRLEPHVRVELPGGFEFTMKPGEAIDVGMLFETLLYYAPFILEL